MVSQTKDVNACNNLNEDAKEDCYYGLASYTNNPDLCKKILSSSINRNGCFSIVAKNKKDVSICNMISDINTKNFCIKSVGPIAEDRPSVKVNYPIVGERLVVGKTYDITLNAVKLGKLVIQLLYNNDDGKIPSYIAGKIGSYTISTDIDPKQKIFSWKVPQDLKYDYNQITIWGIPEGCSDCGNISGESGIFKIVK